MCLSGFLSSGNPTSSYIPPPTFPLPTPLPSSLVMPPLPSVIASYVLVSLSVPSAKVPYFISALWRITWDHVYWCRSHNGIIPSTNSNNIYSHKISKLLPYQLHFCFTVSKFTCQALPLATSYRCLMCVSHVQQFNWNSSFCIFFFLLISTFNLIH